jgi:hypothetical protein
VNPDYALPYTLSLAAATAFLGAGIALWVYSFINRQAQDRQFRHEIEARWFESIYAPLYEDTKSAVESVEGCRPTGFGKWGEIRASRFGPFVDQRIHAELDRVAEQFTGYYRAWQRGYERAETIITDYLRGNLAAEFADAIKSNLTNWLSGDFPFVFNPDVAAPTDYARGQFTQAIKGLFSRPGPVLTVPSQDELGIWFSAIKTQLKEDEAVKAVFRERQRVFESAKAIHDAVLQRMRHPFEQP